MQVEKKQQESAGGNFKQKSLDAASRGWLHFDLGAAEALNKRDLEGLGRWRGKQLQTQDPGGMQRQSPASGPQDPVRCPWSSQGQSSAALSPAEGRREK